MKEFGELVKIGNEYGRVIGIRGKRMRGDKVVRITLIIRKVGEK